MGHNMHGVRKYLRQVAGVDIEERRLPLDGDPTMRPRSALRASSPAAPVAQTTAPSSDASDTMEPPSA